MELGALGGGEGEEDGGGGAGGLYNSIGRGHTSNTMMSLFQSNTSEITIASSK